MTQDHLSESIAYVREHAPFQPSLAIVLGSGLGDFADNIFQSTSISTADIPHYPRSSVEGHKGRIVFAELSGKPFLAFQGRTHFYESNNLDAVVYPIRVAFALGVRTLILTNAAGGVNTTFRAGDLMILTDHINLTLARLAGLTTGAGLPHQVYSPSLIEKAERAAASSGIVVRKGIYAGLKGPTYETASEVGMLSRLGADAVGMSTVFEASLAASLGMAVLGISCITNLGTGLTPDKLSHAEVTDVGNRVKKTFADLISSTIALF